MLTWFRNLLLLCLFAAGGYFAYDRFSGAPAQAAAPAGAPPAMPVDVAKVVEKEVMIWTDFSGRLSAVDQAEVRARVPGTVESVHFTDGALVKKGDLLFTIDKRPYQAERDRAAGALAAAEAQSVSARKEAARADRLFKEKALSSRDYEQRREGIAVAEGAVKTAAGALAAAQLNLDYAEIRAPFDGRAGRAEVTAGNLVGAGTPVLTTVVSSGPVYADFEMDEPTFLHYIGAVAGDVSRIPAELSLAAETGKRRAGRIHSFDNRVNAGSGTIRVRALFDNPDGDLVPGLFARVLVGSPAPRPALLISDRAVGTDQNKKFVYVVGDDGKPQYRVVRLGPAAEGLRVVEEGVNAGEKIVIAGLQRIRPGVVVAPQDVPMVQEPAAPAQKP